MLQDSIQILLSFLSALAGAGISSYVARLYIEKSLKDLETALSMCHELNKNLATILVKIEEIEPLKELLYEHDRKIAILGTRNNGSGKHRTNS